MGGSSVIPDHFLLGRKLDAKVSSVLGAVCTYHVWGVWGGGGFTCEPVKGVCSACARAGVEVKGTALRAYRNVQYSRAIRRSMGGWRKAATYLKRCFASCCYRAHRQE